MKKLSILLLCLLSCLIGGVATYLILTHKNIGIPDRWIYFQKASSEGKSFPPSYSSLDSFIESRREIKFPSIRKIELKAKFVDTETLGYVAEIEVENLDTTQIPEKYRKERTSVGGRWSRGPIDQVAYEMIMDISLFDKDNFILSELETEPQEIESGTINRYQETLKVPALPNIATRTRKIAAGIRLTKCITCEGE